MMPKTNHSHINHMIDMYENEEQPFRKIHRMIDLFEVIIKTHTALMIADYFRIRNLSDNIKNFLAEGLRKPSLGLWQGFTRAIVYDLALPEKINKEQFEALNKAYVTSEKLYTYCSGDLYRLNAELPESKRKDIINNLIISNYSFVNVPFINDFYNYFMEWDKKLSSDKDSENKNNVINLRNKYAHRATPSDEECKKDIKAYSAVLEYMLKAKWLYETHVCVFHKTCYGYKTLDLEGDYIKLSEDLISNALRSNASIIKEDKPYLVKQNGDLLELFPIMVYKSLKPGEAYILFFNDLNSNKRISILNYPYSLHLIDEEMYKPFKEVIDIENWKNLTKTRYIDMLDSENEDFVGRETEIEKLKSIIHNRQHGYLFVQGEPGIGKTALISKVISQLKKENLYIIKYAASRANSSSEIKTFQSHIIHELNEFGLNLTYGKNVEENSSLIEDGLKRLSVLLKDKKLVMFIDGIDEFEIKNNSSYINYLLSDKYDNIFIVYSCRETDATLRLYNRLDILCKDQFSIGKLTEDDIWQIISSRSNKYELTKEYISVIAERSKGNPLYMNLLCTSLENGSKLQDKINNLPEEIEQWFEEFISRYRKHALGDCIMQILYIFAAAKDSINCKFIYEVMKQNHNNKYTEVDVENALNVLLEVLVESETMSKFYHIFHESFIAYLNTQRKDNILEAEKNIILLCKHWKDYEGYYFEDYIARFYASHLYERRIYDAVIELSLDEEYLKFQIKASGSYNSSIHMYELALKAAAHKNDNDKAAEVCKRQIELYKDYGNETVSLLNNIETNGNFTRLLDKIQYCSVKEKIIIYTNLLNYYMFKVEDEEIPKNTASKILKHIEDNLVDDITILNWLDIVPMYFLVKVMAKIKELGLNYFIIMKRMKYGGDFSSLGIRISDYSGITKEQTNWIKASSLSETELNIIEEMKQSVSGLNKELERYDELNCISNENEDYINSRCLIISKLIEKKDINKLISQFENNLYESALYLNLLTEKVSDYQLFEEIIDRLISNSKVKDTVIYWLVSKYVYEDVDRALAFTSKLTDINIKLQCYELIIMEFLNKEFVDRAKTVLSEMENLVNSQKNPLLFYNKNSVILQFMQYYFYKNDIEKVKFYYNKLGDLNYKNDKILCSGYIIELLIMQGKYNEAFKLLYNQYKLSLNKDIHIFYELIETLVMRMGLGNHIEEACILAEYIGDQNTRNRVLRNLLDIYVQNEGFSDFIYILNKQLVKFETSLILKKEISKSFIKQLYYKSNYNEARWLIASALEDAGTIENTEVKIKEYKSIAVLALEFEDFDQFIEIYKLTEACIEANFNYPGKIKEYENIIDIILKSINKNQDIRIIDLLISILKYNVMNTEKAQNKAWQFIVKRIIDTLIDLGIYDKAEKLLNYIEQSLSRYSLIDFFEFRIYISNRHFTLGKANEGILQQILSELINQCIKIGDCEKFFALLDEALFENNIELAYKILQYINGLLVAAQNDELKLEVLYKLNKVYFELNDIEALKTNTEELVKVLNKHANTKTDPKYVCQLNKYGFHNELQPFVDKRLELLAKPKTDDNLSFILKYISELQAAAELMAKLHRFNEAFLFMDKICEYQQKYSHLEKISNSADDTIFSNSFHVFNEDSHVITLMIELMKQGNIDLIIDNIKHVTLQDKFKISSDFLYELKHAIALIDKEKALKLISIINSKTTYCSVRSSIASELYMEGHKEAALALIKKLGGKNPLSLYMDLVLNMKLNSENLQDLFKLSDLQSSGEDKAALLTWAVQDMDKDLLLLFLEKIDSNEKISSHVKNEIFKGISTNYQVLDTDIILKIMSLNHIDIDIIKKYLEAYLLTMLSNKERYSDDDFSSLSKYIYFPNFNKCDSNDFSYSNLDSWLIKVEDEEDKMIIKLLASKVSKNKITEVDFNNEIKKYIH